MKKKSSGKITSDNGIRNCLVPTWLIIPHISLCGRSFWRRLFVSRCDWNSNDCRLARLFAQRETQEDVLQYYRRSRRGALILRPSSVGLQVIWPIKGPLSQRRDGDRSSLLRAELCCSSARPIHAAESAECGGSRSRVRGDRQRHPDPPAGHRRGPAHTRSGSHSVHANIGLLKPNFIPKKKNPHPHPHQRCDKNHLGRDESQAM